MDSLKYSLKDLVGTPFALDPPITVDPGRVLLTLKHGSPRDIVKPGRRLRRGKGLPLTMAPSGVAISTEEVPVTVTCQNIVLPGPYDLPTITIAIRIQVDRSQDYQGLKDYVANKGLNFADLLDAEVHSEVDRRVRVAFQGRTHRELYEAGNLSDLVDLTTPLLDGLFHIDLKAFATPTWHPEFEAARAAQARDDRERVEKTLELGQTPLNLALEEAEDRLLAAKASRRDMDLAAYENPEILALNQQQEHETRLALIEQLDSIRRAGGSDLVREILAQSGDSAPGGDNFHREDRPPRQPESIGVGSTDGDLPSVGWKIDPSLLRLWTRANMAAEALAIGLTDSIPPALFVVSPSCLSADDIGTIEITIAQVFGADRVISIDEVSTPGAMVAKYLSHHIDGFEDSAVQVVCRASNSRLVLELSSATARIGPGVRQLRSPESDALDALYAVLPFDIIDVELADSA